MEEKWYYEDRDNNACICKTCFAVIGSCGEGNWCACEQHREIINKRIINDSVIKRNFGFERDHKCT